MRAGERGSRRAGEIGLYAPVLRAPDHVHEHADDCIVLVMKFVSDLPLPRSYAHAFGNSHDPRYLRLRSLLASASLTTCSVAPSHSMLRRSLSESIPSKATFVE